MQMKRWTSVFLFSSCSFSFFMFSSFFFSSSSCCRSDCFFLSWRDREKVERQRQTCSVINISNVTLQIVNHIRLATCGPGFGRVLFLIDLHKLLNVKHCYTVDVMTSVTQTETKDEPQSSWSPAPLCRSSLLPQLPPSAAGPPGERWPETRPTHFIMEGKWWYHKVTHSYVPLVWFLQLFPFSIPSFPWVAYSLFLLQEHDDL